jgi:hypothetical protein
MNSLGLDLNYECGFCDRAQCNFVGAIDEPRPSGICAADVASSAEHFQPLHHPLSVRVRPEIVFVRGVRAVDVSQSLRDIEGCLRAQRSQIYQLGIRSTVALNTLANALHQMQFVDLFARDRQGGNLGLLNSRASSADRKTHRHDLRSSGLPQLADL